MKNTSINAVLEVSSSNGKIRVYQIGKSKDYQLVVPQNIRTIKGIERNWGSRGYARTLNKVNSSSVNVAVKYTRRG